MTKIEIREQFARLSGRFDLVTDFNAGDFTDNGADYFIENGQRWLERFINVKRSQSRVFQQLSAGSYYTVFKMARSIKEVWVDNGVDERYMLEKKTMPELRNLFDEPVDEIDPGPPLYYTPAKLRAVPDAGNLLQEDEYPLLLEDGYNLLEESFFEASSLNYLDYIMPNSHDYNGILIAPPIDETYTIETVGVFYLPTLTEDSDMNWWSSQHPDMLINAALRQLEVSYRNSEGVRDWENAIMPDIMNVDKDIIDEEITGIDQMEG